MNMTPIVLHRLDRAEIAQILKTAAGSYAPGEDWDKVADQVVTAAKAVLGEQGASESEQPDAATDEDYVHPDYGLAPFPADGGLSCVKCGDDNIRGFHRPEGSSPEHLEWLCQSCGAVYRTALRS